MTAEFAASLTDITLSAGTFALGLTVGSRKNARPWSALFIALAIAAAVGALFHGSEKFHTHAFMVLVATTSTAAAFLFLAACLCVAKPHLKLLSWLWPLFGIGGLAFGGVLANFPFWYVSVTAGLCMLLALTVLPKAPSKKARNWIYLGVATTVFGLLCQKFLHGEGLLSNNAVFHELQLVGNFFYWTGARKT